MMNPLQTLRLLDWAKRHSQAAEEHNKEKKEQLRLLYEAEQDNNKHSNLKKSLTKAAIKHSDPNKPALNLEDHINQFRISTEFKVDDANL
ncbi:hypothetical protein BY996DRAFT_8401632 [Phakopsora pachyrhizi]|nr:hypothetical protein BY996DRAFT_8401632 [Phakopsora pachyrhizi]